ncbi:MAG: thiamine-phosphate kinase [Campylobacterales bacterium]
MNLEEYFISRLENRWIGDDGAYIPGKGGEWIVVKDLFVEGVHFKREWFQSLAQVARKGVLVNLSDIFAGGGVPVYGLIGIGFPKDLGRRGTEELATGFKKVAEEFQFQIVGGDTIEHPTILISVTLIGKVQKRLERIGRKGDYIGITGGIGRNWWELQKALRGGRVSPRSRLISPKLPVEFLRRGIRLLRGGIDISDGLFRELEEISLRSRVGAKIYRKGKGSLLRATGRRFQRNRNFRRVGCSGEEYQLLFTCPPRHWLGLERRGRVARVPLFKIGRIVRGKVKYRCTPHHF